MNLTKRKQQYKRNLNLNKQFILFNAVDDDYDDGNLLDTNYYHIYKINI